MGKRRNNVVIIPLALLFFAILGLNIWVFKSTARTNSDKTVVEHTQLEFFVPDKRILLQASISDPIGIAEARLYFGTSVKNLVFSEMIPEGDSYVGIIPAPSSRTDKIFYSFLAVNYNGDVTKTGLFELQASKNVGFVPTWQGNLDEYGKTLILGKESTLESPSTSLEGFADSIIVNAVKPEERYFLAKKVERVAGLSTIDGGDVEPAEEAGEVKGGWSKKKKIAVIGGVLGAAAIGGGIAAASGGGGGGGDGKKATTTTTTTTTTATTPPTTLPTNQPFQSPAQGVSGGTITFTPPDPEVGDDVSIAIHFDNLFGLDEGNEGWFIRVGDNDGSNNFSSCDTFGGPFSPLNCNLNNILERGTTPNRIRLWVNTDKAVKFFDQELLLQFK